jgi:APA family basic amino acid/polyamine antiporter
MRDNARPGLLRALGTFDASLIVIGGIIGSGIFVNPSRVAALVHTGPLVMTAWIIGGLVALIGAGVFAELAARRPLDGGLYAYLRDAFHPVVAFCYGWTVLLVSQSGGAAASAVTFAFYLPAITGVPLSQPAAVGIAVGVIGLFTVVNCLGVRESTSAQNGFVIVKVAAIAGVIVIGAFATIRALGSHAEPAQLPDSPLVALGLALVPVMFAYSGWQTTSFMSGEMQQPTRSLPRGFFFGVLGVIALYLAMNVVCLGALGERGLAATDRPAAAVVQAAFGPVGAKIMAIIVAISTLGFITNQILVSPRVFYQMAADGTFFKALAKIDPRSHVPIVAIATQGIAAMLVAVSGKYDTILNWVTSVDYIFFTFAALALIIFRSRDRKAGEEGTGYRIPLHPFSTGLFMIVAAAMVADVLIKTPGDSAIGLLVLLTGVPVWYVFSRMKARKV